MARNIALSATAATKAVAAQITPAHTALTFRNHRWLETTGLVTHALNLQLLLPGLPGSREAVSVVGYRSV